MKIFISYRRDDSAGYAGRLFDHLIAHFGTKSVFMDIDTIEPGEDFRNVIQTAVGTCDVVLVMIGKQWLGITDPQGQRRLDDPHDWVRAEIASALANPRVRVIPVLVRGAAMPGEHELPEGLKELAWRNAIELSDSRFQHDANRLIGVIERMVGKPEKPSVAVRPKSSAARRWGIMIGLVSLSLIICLVSYRFLPSVFSAPPTPEIKTETAPLTLLLQASPTFASESEIVLTLPPSTSTGIPSPLPSDVPATPTSTEVWYGVLAIRLPTVEEIRAGMPGDIWQENHIGRADILSPGRKKYSGYAQIGKEYLFQVYWCALQTNLLRQNLEHMSTTFLINDQVIPDRYLLPYDLITNGWQCTYQYVVLGGWVANQKYKIEARRSILAEITDGQTNYQPGEYVYELDIEAR